MLMNIPQSFTPDLLELLMKMGHGEKLLISDGNFPQSSAVNGAADRIYITGFTVAELLESVLKFFPLDQAVESAAVVMESAKEGDAYERYAAIIGSAPTHTRLDTVSRFDFYELAHTAVGVIVTSDTVKGGNILIAKGVVRD